MYLKNTFIGDHTKINCIFKSHLLCVSLLVLFLYWFRAWRWGYYKYFPFISMCTHTFLVGVSCCQVYQCQKIFRVFIKMDSVVTECIYWKACYDTVHLQNDNRNSKCELGNDMTACTIQELRLQLKFFKKRTKRDDQGEEVTCVSYGEDQRTHKRHLNFV